MAPCWLPFTSEMIAPSHLAPQKSLHEYTVFQLLIFAATKGWIRWREFLAAELCRFKLLLTRAVKALRKTQILLAQMRSLHPMFGLLHPSGKTRHLITAYPDMYRLEVSFIRRQVIIMGFHAGSFTGLALNQVLCDMGNFEGLSK